MVDALPAWAAQYVGLPYLPGGQSRDGVDCWGLVMMVWAEVYGIPLPDYSGKRWSAPADTEQVALDAIRYANRFSAVRPGKEREGDGILFRMRGAPTHVGVVLTPGVMLHAFEGSDSCVEPYTSWRWNKRIAGIYRYEP